MTRRAGSGNTNDTQDTEIRQWHLGPRVASCVCRHGMGGHGVASAVAVAAAAASCLSRGAVKRRRLKHLNPFRTFLRLLRVFLSTISANYDAV